MIEQIMSAAEWQAMRVVWAHPGSNSQFIISSLQEGFDWQAATIKTLLGRLRKKGYLEMEKVGTTYRYQPLVTEKEHLSGQIQTILDNVCSTKNGQLVEALLEQGQFSTSDLHKILSKIENLTKNSPETLICHCLSGQCTCGHHH
ncbi:CopY/TcrY family copper transport repressor [Streptococcus gallinaceus]|nr:CopY/TcrY family copper transport repressor [Streptococcus gallinaceus]MCP1639858.1 CopY/TcrY family copper transport repressor [Streptococcus gallinaceus]MCP1770770.1 CopY/TcrY family copper transport repressor [Streptococcus gallinaceus]